MKRKLLKLFTVIAVYILSGFINETHACSVAGTAAANRDSVCFEDTVIVSLTGYTGTIFQWQSNDGTGWINEIGPGATTDTYSLLLAVTKQLRAIVTEIGCPSDTSNIISITSGVIAQPVGVGASRCGFGPITLTGTGSAGGSLKWYANPTGGSPLGTGTTFTPTVGTTTTFYLEDNTYSGGGGGNTASPLVITEFDIDDATSGGAGDDLEIQNVSSQPLNVTGWTVAVSNNYANINTVNPNVQVLSGVLQPGDILSFTDNAAGPGYWGSNILWNSGNWKN